MQYLQRDYEDATESPNTIFWSYALLYYINDNACDMCVYPWYVFIHNA